MPARLRRWPGWPARSRRWPLRPSWPARSRRWPLRPGWPSRSRRWPLRPSWPGQVASLAQAGLAVAVVLLYGAFRDQWLLPHDDGAPTFGLRTTWVFASHQLGAVAAIVAGVVRDTTGTYDLPWSPRPAPARSPR